MTFFQQYLLIFFLSFTLKTRFYKYRSRLWARRRRVQGDSRTEKKIDIRYIYVHEIFILFSTNWSRQINVFFLSILISVDLRVFVVCTISSATPIRFYAQPYRDLVDRGSRRPVTVYRNPREPFRRISVRYSMLAATEIRIQKLSQTDSLTISEVRKNTFSS